MISQTALIWAGTTAAGAAAVGAAAVSLTEPGLLCPKPPAVVVAPPVLPSPPPPDGAVVSPETAARPEFDVVSVAPGGETVVAGHAAPNAKVALLDGARTLGEATADARGQFVIVPERLAAGDHSLVLSTREGAGAGRSHAAAVSVAVALPALLAPSGRPAAATPPAPAPTGSSEVAIRSVEANADGRVAAIGAAAANATVRLYVGGAFVGDAKTGGNGRWSLTIERGMTAGAYVIRADEIAPGDARVIARAEAAFTVPALAPRTNAPPAAPAPTARSPADVVVDSVQTHRVDRGHTLWGISQKFFGDGARFAVIFSANSEQIRDPNLIYPGQTFVVPSRDPTP